jgi:hypothetical protein
VDGCHSSTRWLGTIARRGGIELVSHNVLFLSASKGMASEDILEKRKISPQSLGRLYLFLKMGHSPQPPIIHSLVRSAVRTIVLSRDKEEALLVATGCPELFSARLYQ